MIGAGGRGHGREDSAAAPTDSREEAAEAQGDLRDFRAVEPLIASLGDRESGVREEAAEALGKIGDPGAVGALAEAVNGPLHDVRRKAGRALDYLR